MEVQARGANVLALTTETHRDAMAARTPRVLTVPDVEPIFAAQLGGPLRLLAYYIALGRVMTSTSPGTWPRASPWSKNSQYTEEL